MKIGIKEITIKNQKVMIKIDIWDENRDERRSNIEDNKNIPPIYISPISLELELERDEMQEGINLISEKVAKAISFELDTDVEIFDAKR